MTNPSTGIATVSKFLPSVADVHELLRNERTRHEQFKPAYTVYKKLDVDSFPDGYEFDVARRKIFVECLELEKEFPNASHRHFSPMREKWDGPVTERALHPERSKS